MPKAPPTLTAPRTPPTSRSSRRVALLRFARHRVGAAVLEVGMGGRLDSTNVCQPLVSVITNISFDHTQQLGTTLAAIAGEKAGILKPQVPLISGVTTPEPREVIHQVARSHDCPVVELGRDFHFRYRPPQNVDCGGQLSSLDFSYAAHDTKVEYRGLELALIGRHQAANAAVALATLVELGRHGFQVPEPAVRRGLSSVRWPARVELIQREPAIVLDSAHNVASAEALVQVLDESFSPRRRLLIFATTRDKNVRGMLEALLPRFDEVIFTRYWSNPRAVPAEDLDAAAEGIGTATRHVCPDPQTAWRLAMRVATQQHLIVIAGSFFIAAEMRAVIEQTGGTAGATKTPGQAEG